MRIWIVALVSIVVGLATGVVSGLWATDLFSVAATPTGETGEGDPNMPPLAPRSGPQPRLEVEKTAFDFGKMERKVKGSHTFVFRNTGNYPLVLKKGKTSCKCTLSNLTEDEVRPGEAANVNLEWTAKAGDTKFRQDAVIFTNDPKRRKVTLVVTGVIVDSVMVNPVDVVFTNLTHDEEASAKTRVFTSLADEVRVEGQTFQNEETAGHFVIHSEPLPADNLPEGMKGGCEVTITIKPGLPEGPIQQKIRLHLNVPDIADPEITIGGRIGSPVLIVGPKNWDQERGVLNLGSIKREAGAATDLKLMIRGPRRQEARLEPPRVEPDFIKATLGERQELTNVVAVPLRIEIPPGSPVVNHLGYEPGSMAVVKIPTNDPELGDVQIRIAFAIVE